MHCRNGLVQACPFNGQLQNLTRSIPAEMPTQVQALGSAVPVGTLCLAIYYSAAHRHLYAAVFQGGAGPLVPQGGHGLLGTIYTTGHIIPAIGLPSNKK